jgi:hypothetical protein
MRVGLLVDGDSEQALVHLYQPLAKLTGNTFIRPAVIAVNGTAPPGRVAAECLKVIRIVETRYEVQEVVILIDREDNPKCPGDLSSDIEKEVKGRLKGLSNCKVKVIIKNRMFENWLVADGDALAAQPGRFKWTQARRRRAEPNKADSIDDPKALLESATIGASYEKVKDSDRILRKADSLRIAANSRSFRKFLQCVGHPNYSVQSRKPA